MSEQTIYYAAFQGMVTARDFCRDEACRGWFLSEVDTWHQCPCPAGRLVPHPESDDALLESDRLDTLEPGPYAAPALPVDPSDDIPF